MAQSPEARGVESLVDAQSIYRRNLAELNRRIRDGETFSGHERNCAFLNLADGRFATVSATFGLDFDDDARAHALVDWDQDGDIDIWTTNRTGPALRFLRNQLPSSTHYVSLELQGTNCNRDAIGAEVTIKLVGDERPILRQLAAGSGFLSQSSKRMTIGLGENAKIELLQVRWPGAGEKEVITGVTAGHAWRVVQGRGEGELIPPRPAIEIPTEALQPEEDIAPAQILLTSGYLLPAVPYLSHDGKPASIRAQSPSRKRPTLISLWASWCAPCVREMAEFQAARDEFNEARIDVLTLSLDEVDDQAGTAAEAQALANRIAPNLLHGMATQQTVVAIQAVMDLPFLQHRDLALPLSLLVGDDDRLWAVYRGPVDVRRIVEDSRRSQVSYEERVPLALPMPGKWHRLPPVPSTFVVLTNLVQAGEVDLVAELVRTHRTAFEEERGFSQLLAWIGDERMKRGEVREAFRLLDESLQLDPNNLMVANNAAWQYATHPDHAARDGAKAVKWATVAAEATKYQNVAVLSTLAAALAENGEHPKAVEITQRALTLASQQGDTDAIAKCQQRLDLYRSGKSLP